jgi:hypothetical protein
VLAEQGRFALVEGRVYVNFGRRWTEDFTVTILVRGWIEERGGPWIEATRPEQIEFADRE